jgi:cysteine-rich repeat protein
MRRSAPVLAAALLALAGCPTVGVPNLTSTSRGDCEPGALGCVCEEASSRCDGGLVCSGGICVAPEEDSSSGDSRTTGESESGSSGGGSSEASGSTTGLDETTGDASASSSGSTGAASASSTGGETTGPPAPFCGDGQVDEGEACDDGNEVEGDGCDPDCTPNPYELDGFAEGVALAELKGWTLCYDSANAPYDGWVFKDFEESCLLAPAATHLLLACSAESDADAVTAVGGGLPEAYDDAWNPAVKVGSVWWLFQAGAFGALSGPDLASAPQRVVVRWGKSDPKYFYSGVCNGSADAQHMLAFTR